jgi:hypothetical protein
MPNEQDQGERKWIDDLEVENANIKWAFSHFDGREDTFNNEGDHNFTIIIDDEQEARRLMDEGWNIRTMEGREEGDPPEYLLKVKISFRFSAPAIFFLKGERRYRADEVDLVDIKRATCEQLDVIIQPSPWVHGRDSGISAYVKEMYVKIKESRFAERYADYEEVK